MKDKTFQCQDCKNEFREKAYTPETVARKLCPQCYTKKCVRGGGVILKIGDIVTLKEINRWKNKKYKDIFIPARYDKVDGKAWWNREKRKVLNDTKFIIVRLP